MRIWLRLGLAVCLSILILGSSGWADTTHFPSQMDSPQCQDFLNFVINSGQLRTDGLVIVQDGRIQYEYYGPGYGVQIPHPLFSVTKTITGALLGIAVRDGKLDLTRHLNEFLPSRDGNKSYDRIEIGNLFYMDAGFSWDEMYVGDVAQNTLLEMLYGTGRSNMARFAADLPIIPEGPGYQWRYTTGTPVITQAVLKQVYGENYAEMPWQQLFRPLGMQNVVFERDATETFIGGSAAFATPRDVAKLGLLYLNRGTWNGKTILPEEWIERTLTPSPGYLSPGTVIRDITDDGVYGGSMWLNRAVKPGWGRPYPYSPEDMFLAIGHFGQLMVILPSQKLVLARTGFDWEINSKVDRIVSSAIACFSDPSYRVGEIIPPPPESLPSWGGEWEMLQSAIREDLLQAAVAKSVCSCHFISGLDPNTCVAHSNIPNASWTTRVEIRGSGTDQDPYEAIGELSELSRVLGRKKGKAARAWFDPSHPEYGCTLL